MAKIRQLLAKYHNIIIYFIFGVFTTLVNFLVYFPLYNWLCFSGTVSNVLAWIAAVVFAFVTNKPFVFKSNDWSANVVIPELTKFVGCRIGSGLAETAIIFIAVDLLSFNGNIIKLLTSILVVILNYVASKLVVFRRNER